MNIDEPKFTAYALNALSPEEKEACEPGVLAEESLLREAELTASFAEKLKGAFTSETNARLSAAHWREIYAEAGLEQPPGVIPFEPEQQKRFPIWALSAAAGVMFGAVIASLAITWNDRSVLIADVPSPTPVKPSAIPDSVVVQPLQTVSVPVSAPQPAVLKIAESVAVVPRPQAPVVIVKNDTLPPMVVEFTVQPDERSVALDAVELADSIAKIEELQSLPETEEPIVRPAVSQPRATPFFPPLRLSAQPSAPSVLPKPVVSAAPAQPAPSVAATRPAVSVSPAVEKKPAVFAFSPPPAKKITVTVPDTGMPKNSAASSSRVQQLASIDSNIERLRLGGATLDDVNAAGFTPALSGFASSAAGAVSVGVPFVKIASTTAASAAGDSVLNFAGGSSVLGNSAFVVYVLFDNNGLPLSLTSGAARVLNISDPVSLTLQP